MIRYLARPSLRGLELCRADHWSLCTGLVKKHSILSYVFTSYTESVFIRFVSIPLRSRTAELSGLRKIAWKTWRAGVGMTREE